MVRLAIKVNHPSILWNIGAPKPSHQKMWKDVRHYLMIRQHCISISKTLRSDLFVEKKGWSLQRPCSAAHKANLPCNICNIQYVTCNMCNMKYTICNMCNIKYAICEYSNRVKAISLRSKSILIQNYRVSQKTHFQNGVGATLLWLNQK